MIIDTKFIKNEYCKIEKAQYERYPAFSYAINLIGMDPHKSIIYYEDKEVYNGKYMCYTDQIKFIKNELTIIKRDKKLNELLNDKDI